MSSAPAPALESREFSHRILNIGFLTGLVLAMLCFVAASAYMFRYLSSVDSLFNDLFKAASQGTVNLDMADLLIHGRLVAAKFSLLSCGILTGLSLGLIGFCLFLVGAKGEIDARAETPSAKVALTRLAPGALVLLCAAILIGVCATHEVSFETEIDGNKTAGKTSSVNPGGGSKTDDLPSEKTDQRP